GTVLGAGLLAVRDALGIEDAADDMVAHARQVADPAAADQHDGVLLEVVPFTGDVSGDLHAIGEAHAGDLAQRRVGLLGRHGFHLEADAALLWAAVQGGVLWLAVLLAPGLAHQLVNRRHSTLLSPRAGAHGCGRLAVKAENHYGMRPTRRVKGSFGRTRLHQLLAVLRLLEGRAGGQIDLHLGLLVHVEAGARRDQVAQDYVLLQAHEVVHLAGQGGFSQHLGRLLEAGRRDEAVGLHRGLGDPQELGRAGRRRGRHMRRRLAVVFLQAVGFFFVGVLGDNLVGLELAVGGVLDLDAFLEALVDLPEGELVDDRAGQQAGVAHRLDFYFAEHLGDDDLDVLVVDVHALAAVDRLAL